MDRKDEELIERFINRIKEEISTIEAAVLFGSMARGDYDKRSDIDIMLIIREEQPQTHNETISRIVTELHPHRELRTVVTNLRDYDEEYYQNVFREGKVLFGKIILSPENLALKPYLLVSYNLSGKPNTLQVKIAKRVHGYTSKKVIDGKKKEYTYPGLDKLYGGKIVSKSALILPFDKGMEFTEELRQMNIPYTVFKIWM